MAKKTAEDLIIELKELFVEREIKYINNQLTKEDKKRTQEQIDLDDELDKEERKFLINLKSKIKYVEALNNQLTGKTGKERSRVEEDFYDKIKGIKSLVGEIVRAIPKNNS